MSAKVITNYCRITERQIMELLRGEGNLKTFGFGLVSQTWTVSISDKGGLLKIQVCFIQSLGQHGLV